MVRLKRFSASKENRLMTNPQKVTLTRVSGSQEEKMTLNPHKKVTLTPVSGSQEKKLALTPQKKRPTVSPQTVSPQKKMLKLSPQKKRLKLSPQKKWLTPSPPRGSKEKKVGRSPSSRSKEKSYRGSSLDQFRNVTIIAPLGHDKSTLIGCLVETAAFSPPEADCSVVHKTESYDLDNGVGIHIKPSDQSLCYKMSKEWLERHNVKVPSNIFTLNLINSPHHADLPSEATPSFCLPDGAMIVVDALDGMSADTETLLRRALVERVKPIYSLNISGKHFLDLPSDGEKGYQIFASCVQTANAILENINDKLLGDVQLRPEKGTSAFWCSEFGWAFTLTGFARFYAKKYGLHEKKMREKLWGDNFYDTSTKKWTSENTGSPTCKRGFVLLCYDPIRKIVECCKNSNTTKLCSLLERFDVKLKWSDEKLDQTALMRQVMQTWLPAGSTFVDMIFSHLPSPLKAQCYRVENLYSGPLNDCFATAIRRCDSSGPLMMYISNMVPASDGTTGLVALGRVFSGHVTPDMKVQLIGQNYASVEDYVLRVGKKNESAFKHCTGDITLVGLKHFIENVTVTSLHQVDACAIRPTKIHLVPYVRIAEQNDITLESVCEMSQEKYHVPYTLYNDLYLHQREAIFWLWSTDCNGSGAILADDMGLGKTREIAVFLAGLIHSKLITTALIIAPTTVIDDWEDVLKLVGIDCKKFLGAKDASTLKSTRNGSVLLTSYDAYRIHVVKEAIDWDYVFLDEGHRIKNKNTNLYWSLQSITSNHKIIVTGTPVQNNLLEFHTLMDFCNPGLLGDVEYFKKNFIIPIDRGKHRDAKPVRQWKCSAALKILRRLVEPFLLRRRKELLKEQGRLNCDKYEILVWVHLSQVQIKLYTTLLEHEGVMSYEGGEALLTSRVAEDVCNHPELLLNEYPEAASQSYKEIRNKLLAIYDENVLRQVESSSKLSFLTFLVSKLREEKHKILIFAQSPRMLLIIENTLASFFEQGSVVRMDGSTPRQQRKELMKRFQESLLSPPFIFLLTTKVGGVGVTLTQARRVIIFDPSKNPSDDDQSVDRAYRIGQGDDVLVYRLVTCATIEEHRYRQKILKGETSCAVLGGQPCIREINKQERNVLSLSPQGFYRCQTQRELATIYGYEAFCRYLRPDLDMIKKSKYVIGLTNHTLLYSIEDDSVECVIETYDNPPCKKPQEVKKIMGPQEGKKVLGSSKSSDNTCLLKGIPKHMVSYLLANDSRKKEHIEMVSGAVISLTKAANLKDQQQLEIFGTCVETEKASELIDDFLKQVQQNPMENIIIYVPNDFLKQLMFGNYDVTLQQIQDVSGAKIERLGPDNHCGKRRLEISGNREQIEMAREMITERLDKWR